MTTFLLGAEILDLLPVAVYACDADGRITRFNRRAEEIWGRRPALNDPDERFCGSYQLFWPDGRPMPHDQTPMARVLQSRTTVRNGEAVILRPDGTRVPVLVNIAPLQDETGVFCGAINCFQDAGALLARKQELSAIMDAVPAIVWVAEDPEARRITGNRAAAEFLRMPPRSNMSKTAPEEERPRHFRVFDTRDRELVGDDLPVQAAARGRELRNFEEKVVFDDGEVRYLFGNAVPLPGPDGRPRGSVAAFIDLTPRREAKEELEDFFENASVGCHWVGPDGTILRANDAELRMLGYAREEYEGRSIEDFHVDRPAISDILARLRNNEVIRNRPSRMRAKDGSVRDVLIDSSVLWRNGTFVHTRCFTRDVTDAKRNQEERLLLLDREREARRTAEVLNGEIRALNAELETRVRERTRALEEALEGLNEFSHTVAHDLRAPLRAMHRFGECLREDYAGKPLDDQGLDYLRSIESNARRMDDLIQGLLTVSRLARAEVVASPVDVEEAFREAAVQIEADVVRGALVRFEGPSARVRGDRLLLVQILANYVSNALKFVPSDRSPRVSVSAEAREGRIRVAVQDNGMGFTPEAGTKLFRMFERLGAARNLPGTGIGLAIAKKAAERMGGEVGAESRPGEGSRFWVDLPTA